MRISIQRLLLAMVTTILTQNDSCAAYLLGINMTAKDRQSLISNNQKIAIALPYPGSENNASVIVTLVLQPMANLTQVAFEPAQVLYLAYSPIGTFDTIKMAQQSRVAFGQTYSFDGVRINGEGNGLEGYVSIYFNAPKNSVAPVIAGLAGYVYDVATGKQASPSPLNYYTLNRYQSRLIPKPKPVAWVFICTDLSIGSVLPLAILKPVPMSAPAPAGSLALAGQPTPVLQIGRYLSVKLDASEPASIYFDITSNAFGYAADPVQ